MGWWATIPVVVAMLVIAGAAAAGGYWVALHVPRRNMRTRGPFLVGVFCGVMVGAGLTARRHGLNAVAGAAARGLPVALSILRRKPETPR